MINLTYEQIIEKIEKGANIPRKEIEEKIENKMIELSNLVSKEGAAHIIAHEFNIKLIENIPSPKIKDLSPKIVYNYLIAKVITIYPIREYKTEKRAGRIGALLIGDETGILRCVIWDENQINQIKDIKEGNILKIKNFACKENNGYKEIHLNNRSQIFINPEGETISQVLIKQEVSFKKISDINENESVKLAGTIVQLFEPRFYDVCLECDKKVKLEGQSYICEEHKSVKPKKIPIVNLFLDDGSGNIRVTCFRDQASSLLSLSLEEIENIKNFEEIKKRIIGKQVEISGRITKNIMLNNLEIIARIVSETDPIKLAELLIK